MQLGRHRLLFQLSSAALGRFGLRYAGYMNGLNVDGGLTLPFLPAEIPWCIRQFCYGVRKIRGYGRILPALARVVPALQTVVVDAYSCGSIYLDFRELICLPVFVHGCYRHQLPEDRILDYLLKAGMKVFDIGPILVTTPPFSAVGSRRAVSS
jgi:hypothetical protein